MKESGLTDREMDKESKSGSMGLDTKDNGEMEKQMATVNYIMQMVLYTKENLLMIKLKETERTHKLMV